MDSQQPGLEFYKDDSGDWRWHVTAVNGNVIAASTEGYENRGDAEENAALSGFRKVDPTQHTRWSAGA